MLLGRHLGTDEYYEPEQFDRTGGLDALTEREARYILRYSTLAGIEDKIFKAATAEGISTER